MSYSRIFKEILKPLLIITVFSTMLSLLADCHHFLSLFNMCSSLDIVVQIEIFLLTIIITVIAIRIALIDTEAKSIREKINTVFDEYKYYGHLLFEEQIDKSINDFYKELQKRFDAQIKIREANLDKMKVEALHKQYNSLKEYRHEHIKAIKPIVFLIAILISSCLIFSFLKLDSYPTAKLTVTLSAYLTTIYTIYEVIHDSVYLFSNPFNINENKS
ncbi:hypothetical protein MCEGE10_02148 [Flavobacteriaceae bacterium]